MSVYSAWGGAAGVASAASETDHLECRRLALGECYRETLTLWEEVEVEETVVEIKSPSHMNSYIFGSELMELLT